jgi:hypothetical protein
MPELTVEQTSILGSLSGIATTVDGLLSSGISAAEVGEKLLAFLSPSAAASLQSLITVLQEVDNLVKKAE